MNDADKYEEIIESYENSLIAVENRINTLIESRNIEMEDFQLLTARIDMLRTERFELMNTIGHMKGYVNALREREANSNGDTMGQ